MALERDELDHLLEREGGSQGGPPPFCIHCGYDMRGSVTLRCAECGQPFIRSEWREQLAHVKRQVDQVREAAEWSRFAAIVAGVSAGAMLLSLLPLSGWVESLIRLAAIVGASASAFLSLNVFRVSALPGWARREFGVNADYRVALGTLVVAAAVVALVLFGP